MYDNMQIYKKIWGQLMLILHVNIVILFVFAAIIYCYNIDILTNFVNDCNPRNATATWNVCINHKKERILNMGLMNCYCSYMEQ